MARARNIKPGLFTNEILGEAKDPNAVILFIGLWCLADREGRLEDRPRKIWASVFPYKPEVPINDLLKFLEDNGFIVRYEVEGISYIQVVNWHQHQSPHHMEVPSNIPAPIGQSNKFNHTPITKKLRERVFKRDGYACKKCKETQNLHIDHILPISKGGSSEESNLQTLCKQCNLTKSAKVVHESSTNRPRIEKKASHPTDSFNTDTSTTDTLIADNSIEKNADLEFDYLWELYGHKKDKAEAKKVFSGCKDKYGEICQAVIQYKDYLKVTGYDPCGLGVWLRNKRWENDYKQLTENYNENNGRANKGNGGQVRTARSQSERIADGIADLVNEYSGSTAEKG